VIDESFSLVDVCFAVCTALDNVGTTVVLSGGSAATYYAPQAYQSRDADFVITMRGNAGANALVMNNLGYEQLGGTYVHNINRYTMWPYANGANAKASRYGSRISKSAHAKKTGRARIPPRSSRADRVRA